MIALKRIPQDRNSYQHISLTNLRDIRNMIIMYSVVFFSGFGLLFFVQSRYTNALYVCLLYIITRNKVRLNRGQLLFILYYIVINVMQDVFFLGSFNFNNFVSAIIKIAIPVVIILSVKDKFFAYYIKIMHLINLIALSIYIILLVAPILGGVFMDIGATMDNGYSYHTLVYSYMVPGSNYYQIVDRLFGPFAEPGMYALFLIVMIIASFILDGKLLNTRGIVAIICLILTQSTAGYLALFIILVYVALQRKSKAIAILMITVLFPIGIYVYQLPFMKDKIEENISMAQAHDYADIGTGRVSKAVQSIGFFKNNWLIGKGLSYETGQFITQEEYSGFSIMHLGGQLGIGGLILYLLGLYRLLVRVQRYYSVTSTGLFGTVLLLGAILLVFTSQQVSYYRPFMLSLVFMGLGNFFSKDGSDRDYMHEQERI